MSFDEDPLESCDECLVAGAVVEFISQCDEKGLTCSLVTDRLGEVETTPAQWITSMQQEAIRVNSTELRQMIRDLCHTLESRHSEYAEPCRTLELMKEGS